VKPRGSFSSSRDGLFQHRCLQTSCCVVQLRLQAPALDGAASVVVVVGAAAVETQVFRQVIACTSQLV